jgi:hypothetical protein
MRNTMNAHWCAISKSGSSGNEDNELVLNAFVTDATKLVTSRTRGPQKQGSGGGNDGGGKGKRSFTGKSKFLGKCNNCGKHGHMKKDC